MASARNPSEDPTSFEEGQRVRIYLGHSTDTEIHIREGVVLGHNPHRVWASAESEREGPALVLKVQRAGFLDRRDPREVEVLHNSTHYWVTGQLNMRAVDNPYRSSYFYDCISGAELI